MSHTSHFFIDGRRVEPIGSRSFNVIDPANKKTVGVHYSTPDLDAPSGDFQQSGNGRERGESGLRAYFEARRMVACNTGL